MNQALVQVAKYYSTKKYSDLGELFLGKSKDNLISVLLDLLTTYTNNKNSSIIREFVTVTLSGYKHSESKIGFNGFKQSSLSNNKPIVCGAKPKNFDTYQLDKYKTKKRKTSPAKLSGGGNFTDYTWVRLNGDKRKNPNMLVSGFVDGKLIYIFEYPFKIQSFIQKLEKQLQKRFPNGNIKGHFLRDADFDYKNYITSPDLEYIFIVDKIFLKEYTNRGFYSHLIHIRNEK